MNNKANYLHRIIDIVIDCCATEIDECGTMSVTKEKVLGRSREENVVLTREILAIQIINAGFSVTTVAQLLKRAPHSVRDMIKNGRDHDKTMRAYNLAMSECSERCKRIGQ